MLSRVNNLPLGENSPNLVTLGLTQVSILRISPFMNSFLTLGKISIQTQTADMTFMDKIYISMTLK
jgi:hypothetical protein